MLFYQNIGQVAPFEMQPGFFVLKQQSSFL